MPQLEIGAAGRHAYDVTITADDATVTNHHVEVPEAFLAELGLTDEQEPVLVRASMRYLLEREPPSSIMRRFSLADITRFFPEYPDVITTRL